MIKSHFDQILVFIILELVFRMAFLSMGMKAKKTNQPDSVSYSAQVFLQVIPFMFTALAIITMLKYKVRLNFVFKNEKIPNSVTLLLHFFTAFTVLGCIVLPLMMVDPHISDRATRITNYTVQFSYLLTLSATSLLLSYKVMSNFNLINHHSISVRVKWLEVMIQMIIYVRLVTSFLQLEWPNTFVTKSRNQIMLMTISFTFAELIPFVVVVIGIN